MVLCYSRYRINLYAYADGYCGRQIYPATALVGPLPSDGWRIDDWLLVAWILSRDGFRLSGQDTIHCTLYVERSILYAYHCADKYDGIHYPEEQQYGYGQGLPAIRVLGTVGFIATMWFVNCAFIDESGFGFTLGENASKFQYTYMQFIVSGILSLVLFAYCFTLPECELKKKEGKVSLMETFGLNAFKLFKRRQMALFFIFSALLGMCLQVTNGFAGPFLTSFKGTPEFADTFAANNATMLTSISQMSEALCILLIPFFLKRFGIKVVMLMSLFAWVFRFGFFGIGDPAMPGVIFFILSCIVYGVAFDFFNVSGGIFVDQECDPSIKASAQGLFMMMTNGIGATIGTLAAGEIVNSFCSWQSIMVNGKEESFLVGDWQTCWFVFAAFALIVGITFAIVFKPEKKPIENIAH